MQTETSLFIAYRKIYKTNRKAMKHIKLFEAFTGQERDTENSAVSAALNYLESKTLKSKTSISKAIEMKAKGAQKPQGNVLAQYTKDIKNLIATELTGKTYKVPSYGMVKPASFKFGQYQDVLWSAVGDDSGAGLAVEATRLEKSKVDSGAIKCSFFLDVFYDLENLRFNFYNPSLDKSPNDVKGMIKLGPENFGGYTHMYKMVGNEIDFENSPTRFTMQQLVTADPRWSVFFGKLADIAAKYATKK